MSTTEEELQSLPVGHPQAGYIESDPRGSDHAGLEPSEVQAEIDARDQDWVDRQAAIAQREHEVATTEPTPQEDAAPVSKSKEKSSSSSSD